MLQVLMILIGIVFLSACDNISLCDANPDAAQCQPLPCKNESDGCQKPIIIYETTLKLSTPTNPAHYEQSETMTGEFFIRLDDPDKTITTGAVFLNVVECTGSDPLKKCTSVVHKDFRSVFDQSVSSIKPEFYNKVYTGDLLRTGLSISFASKVNPSITPGYYVLVIQIYDCQNTNPNTVGTDPQCHRIDQPRGYWMDISTLP